MNTDKNMFFSSSSHGICVESCNPFSLFLSGKKAPGSPRCRITSRSPPITTPVASDQVWVSDNNKKTIAETNAVAIKNAWTNKIKEKTMHALSPKIKHEGRNEAIHAPSADKVFVSWCLAVFWGWQIICVNIKNTWCLGIRSYHYRTYCKVFNLFTIATTTVEHAAHKYIKYLNTKNYSTFCLVSTRTHHLHCCLLTLHPFHPFHPLTLQEMVGRIL